MVIPRTTSSETSRRIGLTMVCGAVVTAFLVTVVATISLRCCDLAQRFHSRRLESDRSKAAFP